MYGRPPTGSLANRPSSRAGAGTSWGRGPAPPGTAVGGAGRNAPTRGGPPGTARPTTASRSGFGYQVLDRPMTQQGLGGMKTGVQGPGRMVQDVTFFQSELRHKIALLNSEINKLNNEYDTINKENTNYMSFQRRADTLADELRELQGQLGDYNTLVDKLHTDSDLEDIERLASQIKAKNERNAQTLDDVFQERQQRETAIRDIEAQMDEERRTVEQQINNLDDTRRATYHELKEQNARYSEEIKSKQLQLDGLTKESSALQQELSQEPGKLRALALSEKVNELRLKKSEMETQIRELEGESGPQEKNRLLQQVKEANQETAAMERRVTELEEQAQKLKENLSELDMEMDANQVEKKAKYEELLKRDRDMQSFIDAYESKKKEALDRNAAIEQKIAAMLERMRILSKPEQLPSPEVFEDLQGDLKFKEKEMRNSENTMEALIQERDRRLADYEKVSQLGSKMEGELTFQRQKIESLKTEISKISDIEGVRASLEAEKQRNEKERDQLLIIRDTLREEVQQHLSATHDAKKASLHENDTATQLAALEQRLRHIEGTNFHLKEYIATKNAESDYKPLAKQVTELMDEMNQQIIKIMAIPPAR